VLTPPDVGDPVDMENVAIRVTVPTSFHRRCVALVAEVADQMALDNVARPTRTARPTLQSALPAVSAVARPMRIARKISHFVRTALAPVAATHPEARETRMDMIVLRSWTGDLTWGVCVTGPTSIPPTSVAQVCVVVAAADADQKAGEIVVPRTEIARKSNHSA